VTIKAVSRREGNIITIEGNAGGEEEVFVVGNRRHRPTNHHSDGAVHHLMDGVAAGGARRASRRCCRFTVTRGGPQRPAAALPHHGQARGELLVGRALTGFLAMDWRRATDSRDLRHHGGIISTPLLCEYEYLKKKKSHETSSSSARMRAGIKMAQRVFAGPSGELAIVAQRRKKRHGSRIPWRSIGENQG